MARGRPLRRRTLRQAFSACLYRRHAQRALRAHLASPTSAYRGGARLNIATLLNTLAAAANLFAFAALSSFHSSPAALSALAVTALYLRTRERRHAFLRRARAGGLPQDGPPPVALRCGRLDCRAWLPRFIACGRNTWHRNAWRHFRWNNGSLADNGCIGDSWRRAERLGRQPSFRHWILHIAVTFTMYASCGVEGRTGFCPWRARYSVYRLALTVQQAAPPRTSHQQYRRCLDLVYRTSAWEHLYISVYDNSTFFLFLLHHNVVPPS